jgi:two-component system response regulator PilR (NtrC family)
MQVKLLRAIQEKRVRRVGATVEEAVDVRIICATHQNLQRRVESGQFRQDLYYRLAVIELQMPSLRDCREDIPDIAEAVLKKLLGRSGGTGVPNLSAKALEALKQYDFPGNVRELENILERAVALAGGEEISLQDLQLSPPSLGPDLGASPPGSDALQVSDAKWPLQEYLDRLEQEAILEALAQTKFNRTAAARLLGITFRALRYRMARLGIQ